MSEFLLSTLTKSAEDFRNNVWPKIKSLPIVGGGELKSVEAVSTNDFKEDLDILAGIDAWQIVRNENMVRGLASRVQWGVDHRTFSIRYSLNSGNSTEFEKRKVAIANKENGHIFPHFTVQAYLNEKDRIVLSAAVIKTENLIAAASMLIERGAVLDSKYPDLYGSKKINGTTFV